ncbi:hypothetical protein G6F42_027024 [Rhizopus arrhizus]|nr:hypothetical protein G6F42_027024 [Rhizopus arrhizus]
MASLFGLSTPVDIEVIFSNEEQRKHMEVKVEKDKKENYPVFLDGETVAGKVGLDLLGKEERRDLPNYAF